MNSLLKAYMRWRIRRAMRRFTRTVKRIDVSMNRLGLSAGIAATALADLHRHWPKDWKEE